MEENLWKIFKNVNYMLEFAEKKNIIILSILAIQFTLIKILDYPIIKNWSFIIGFVLLAIAFLLTLFSFFPRLENDFLKRYISKVTLRRIKEKNLPCVEKDNLIYFGHIRKYSKDEYMSEIKKYFNDFSINEKYFKDLCCQIKENSDIAFNKFQLFRKIIITIIIGQLFFLFSILIHL